MLSPQKTHTVIQSLFPQLTILLGENVATELREQLTPILEQDATVDTQLQLLALINPYPTVLAKFNQQIGDNTLDEDKERYDRQGGNIDSSTAEDIVWVCPMSDCQREYSTQSPLEPAPLCEKHRILMVQSQNSNSRRNRTPALQSILRRVSQTVATSLNREPLS